MVKTIKTAHDKALKKIIFLSIFGIYIGVILFSVFVFYYYMEEFTYESPIISFSKKTWSVLLIVFGALIAVLNFAIIPLTLPLVSTHFGDLDGEDKRMIACGLLLALISSLFSTAMICESFHNFEFNAFANYDGNVFALFAFAVNLLLNGLCWDIFEHFNLTISNLEPADRTSLLWFILFGFRLFYAFNAVAIVLLVWRLLMEGRMAEANVEGRGKKSL